MFSEKEIISFFLSELSDNPDHRNNFFESDAEILSFGAEQVLFTVDEFSKEDLFYEEDPYVLGWNMAVGTISDVLATGGRPVGYGHSVQVSNAWTESYIRELARGINAVLEESNCTFAGGDLGMSDNWKYTGICLGKADKPITRKGCGPGEPLYMTGEVGMGNLQAALTLNNNLKASPDLAGMDFRFKLRQQEAETIAHFASCCIDTSDGLLNALSTLSEINGVGFRVMDPPYIPLGRTVCEALGLPLSLLLMGECGEYELVFAVKKAKEAEFIAKAEHNGSSFVKLGYTLDSDIRELIETNRRYNFTDFNISARSYTDVASYLEDLVKYLTYE